MSRVGVQNPAPSLRDVRDSVLSILLTKSPTPTPHTTPYNPTPRISTIPWTNPAPSQPYTPYPWSPTTPHHTYPSENDVQFAELTAGLLSANDAERRQGRMIEKLGDDLRRAEKEIRVLKKGKGKVGKSGVSRGEVRGVEKKLKEMEDKVRDVKRRNMLLEKESLEAEREARRLGGLLGEVRDRMGGIVRERDEWKGRVGVLEREIAILRREREVGGGSLGGREWGTGVLYGDDDSARSVVVAASYASRSRSRDSSIGCDRSRLRSRSKSPVRDEERVRANPAQVERQLIADIALEAARDELVKLRCQNEELERKLALAQASSPMTHRDEQDDYFGHEQVDKIATDHCCQQRGDEVEQDKDVLGALTELNGEVQVLAGISDCIDLTGELPKVIDYENTLTLLQDMNKYETPVQKARENRPEEVVRNITDRVISVRKTIASKYGEWLSNVTGAKTHTETSSECMESDYGESEDSRTIRGKLNLTDLHEQDGNIAQR